MRLSNATEFVRKFWFKCRYLSGSHPFSIAAAQRSLYFMDGSLAVVLAKGNL